jgi:hypothetical protein
MSKKTKIIIAYIGIGLTILYFLVVAGYFITKSSIAFKCWEAMIIISAPVMLIVLVSVPENTDISKEGWKISSIAFMICTTVITSEAHYNNIISNNITNAEFQANDSLAWGLFMGLAFIFTFLALPSKIAGFRKIRYTILICGCLCLLGLLGPISDITALWFLAVAGYGIGTPVICVQLISFYKSKSELE